MRADPFLELESVSDSQNLTVVKLELKSIKFTSDHENGGNNLLTDNNADWSNSGTAYAQPEWTKAGQNNPISHTKGTSLSIKAKLKVEPSGITFELEGDGPNDYVDFKKSGIPPSTGAEQEIDIDAEEILPSSINVLSKSIAWKAKISGLEFALGSSGVHKIYMTYGTPEGSAITEKRIAYVCSNGSGSTPRTCADSLFGQLPGSIDKSAQDDGPPNIWDVHNDPDSSSQCNGLALFVQAHFNMLGMGSGQIVYGMAKDDGSCEVQSSPPLDPFEPESRSSSHDGTQHGESQTEYLYMHDANNEFHNYEAALFFSNKLYALGFGAYSSATEMMTNAFFIDWYYVGRDTNNVPTAFKCTIDPWQAK